MNTGSQSPIAPQPRGVLLPWWALQLLAWALYCVVSFLSLTLWYGEPEWLHVVQILLEAVSGALLVLPLEWSLRHVQRLPVALSFALQLLCVAALAFLWNVLRMTTFQIFFPDAKIWEEFGGWYFASILIFALWTTLHYIVQAYSAMAEEQARAQKEHLRRVTAEGQSRDAQLQMLRYQINPHFIFNTMNSVNALVATKRNSEAREMIERFSDFLRLTLDDEDRLFVPLEEEIMTINRYLSVEKMRFKDRLETVIDIKPDCHSVPVPALILQPVIENAVRHGVEGQHAQCQITITAKRQDGELVVVITDTGPGLSGDAHSDKRRGGIGMRNIAARLATAYGDNYVFTIENNPAARGAMVTMRLPVENGLA
ncbi:sensor histidine kinase [Alterisphingorhabdus coralli]|uniref:Histidine kinase n=1 Tax=Alterisphingorhabdus coralli TaxID=3071408 RepID=A0AA97I286_9SPHN|nr:histidine kinase [Parasphingorhabdus sp. SCSIO 66989]WOE75530.1 histidine kinase [Parasphingorhabdus sp. SCSIO 66989]